jgi:hypothetical protein
MLQFKPKRSTIMHSPTPQEAERLCDLIVGRFTRRADAHAELIAHGLTDDYAKYVLDVIDHAYGRAILVPLGVQHISSEIDDNVLFVTALNRFLQWQPPPPLKKRWWQFWR